MSVLSKIFGKKKEFKAFCDVSKEPVENGFGYLLTTSQVVESKRYWDNIMTDPEMMSYTINHFTKKDPTATQIRNMVFEKYSTIEKPWIVSDTYIKWFDVDKTEARDLAKRWWDSKGGFAPENTGKAEDILPNDKFTEMKTYAVLEAGREALA